MRDLKSALSTEAIVEIDLWYSVEYTFISLGPCRIPEIIHQVCRAIVSAGAGD